MKVIKLKDLLLEKNTIKLQKEAVPMDIPKTDAPKVAHQLTPPAYVAYADPAGDKNRKGMEPYTRKGIDFTGLGTSEQFQISNEFLNYVKTMENSVKKGYMNGKWMPYLAVEDSKTGKKSYDIGYGHKIKKGEDFSRGISDSQAIELLKKDLEQAKSIAEKYLKQHHMPTNLNKEQWEILTDYAFNLGSLDGFPKMVRAVVEGDLVTARKEYKRHATIGGKKTELARNQYFYTRYLANDKSSTWRGRRA